MKRTVYFPEIFEMIGNAETEDDKIAILHQFRQEKGFYDILQLCYEPTIKWMITRDDIEHLKYDDMDIEDYDLAPSTLFLEARRRLYNFTNARNPPLPKNKIMKLVARMFSSFHHKEVELFKQMVDGSIDEMGMTDDLVRKAFPNLLSPAPPRKPGRPAGAKNKETIAREKKYGPPVQRNPGRPAGAKNKKKTPAKKNTVKKAVVAKKDVVVKKDVGNPTSDGV